MPRLHSWYLRLRAAIRPFRGLSLRRPPWLKRLSNSLYRTNSNILSLRSSTKPLHRSPRLTRGSQLPEPRLSTSIQISQPSLRSQKLLIPSSRVRHWMDPFLLSRLPLSLKASLLRSKGTRRSFLNSESFTSSRSPPAKSDPGNWSISSQARTSTSPTCKYLRRGASSTHTLPLQGSCLLWPRLMHQRY